MASDISPELFADRFLELDGSHDVRVKAGYSLASPRRVLSGEANLALTADLCGAMIVLDDATQAVTLPAIGADDIGLWFEFVQQTAATSTTITADTGDLLAGIAHITSTTAGGNDAFQPDGSDDLIITMNGSTQGGDDGGKLTITAIGADSWWVHAELVGSGTIVTPFS